jgi:hypothetical protein
MTIGTLFTALGVNSTFWEKVTPDSVLKKKSDSSNDSRVHMSKLKMSQFFFPRLCDSWSWRAENVTRNFDSQRWLFTVVVPTSQTCKLLQNSTREFHKPALPRASNFYPRAGPRIGQHYRCVAFESCKAFVFVALSSCPCLRVLQKQACTSNSI